jgi:hypothetical protein
VSENNHSSGTGSSSVPTGLFMKGLPFIIRLPAVGFAAFFFVLALHTLDVVNWGPKYLALVRWGPHGEAYELMTCTIYLIWAAFLWRCAINPLQEKTFLNFTVVANVDRSDNGRIDSRAYRIHAYRPVVSRLVEHSVYAPRREYTPPLRLALVSLRAFGTTYLRFSASPV